MSFKCVFERYLDVTAVESDHKGEFCQLLLDVGDELEGRDRYGLRFESTDTWVKVKAMGAAKRAKLLMFSTYALHSKLREDVGKEPGWDQRKTPEYEEWSAVYDSCRLVSDFNRALAKSALEFREEELIELFEFYGGWSGGVWAWPIEFLWKHLEKFVTTHGFSSELESLTRSMLGWAGIETDSERYEPKFRAQVEKMIFTHVDSDELFVTREGDAVGAIFNQALHENAKSRALTGLCLFAMSASSARPTKKWLKQAGELVARVGVGEYRSFLTSVFKQLEQVKNPVVEVTEYEYTYEREVFVYDENAILLKGLVWASMDCMTDELAVLWGGVAERAYKKIPGIGAASVLVGNAVAYSMAYAPGSSGLSQLSRLKSRMKQLQTQKTLQKFVDEAAKKRGITTSVLEEMAVPDFGLQDGCREIAFGEFKYVLEADDRGKFVAMWHNAAGKAQKSVPAAVKADEELAALLKDEKKVAKQMQQSFAVQRERLDRLYLEDRSWSYEDFCRYYHDHPFVALLSRKLIWRFELKGKMVDAIWHGEQWVDAQGDSVDPSAASKVQLWHPLHVTEDAIVAWRHFVMEHGIRQPSKQAYREIYVITDAEVTTKTYSNRMAAHLLKQHQMKALALGRSWQYSMFGTHDSQGDGRMKLPIPTHGLTAEFWVEPGPEQSVDELSGFFLLVGTDQVRIVDESGEAVELENVPAIVFSEVMRDVDLFVGVTSVGNDPSWSPDWAEARGERANYWESYSFGELGEIAKTRKKVLEQILPKLKIAKVTEIDGKFLRVQGKVRTYKIHLGSSNILMEPDDEYLCIVRDRESAAASKVFLPFEGDAGLSMVLSKAFLLAADDKIKDETILSQINRTREVR